MPSLYNYQERTVEALLEGKHFCILDVGLGKTAIGLTWAKRTKKPKVLVVTTASVRDSGSYLDEAVMWCGEAWESLSSLSVISWAGLGKWTSEHWAELQDYAIIFDEVASAKAGISSQRGKAFLQIANRTDCWAGFTATPGDRWIDYYAYFTACGKIRNKTEFIKRFCFLQTYRGFPEITGYHNADTLHEWWKELSFSPNTEDVEAELPEQTQQYAWFDAPRGYAKCEKTHENKDGEFIESEPEFRHYMRKLCALDPARIKWLQEFVENLNSQCVIFYTYTEQGDAIEKVMPKNIKVWRIDGKTHDIPTVDTVGSRDVILVQWQAGSMGLNLQFAHYWVAATPWDAYWQFHQGRGRIRRIGQQNHMHFYYCRARGTVETGIYRSLAEKRDFSEDEWYAGKEDYVALLEQNKDKIKYE